MKTKILLNRRPIDGPWGGGNLVIRAMCEYLPMFGWEVVHTLESQPDLIYMHDPRPSHDVRIGVVDIANHRAVHGIPVVHRVNECDARKNTAYMDEILRVCSEQSDMTIFVSKWMRDYHITRGWHCDNTHVIVNGVDRQHFRQCPANQKLAGGTTNIVAHHWSDNVLKGEDVYKAIDRFVGQNSEFTFTYIGRTKASFKNARVISPLFGQALGDELSRYDVYVSGSKFDPGPNHIIEALACRIPTYVISTGGGAVEFAGEDHAYETIDELLCILKTGDYRVNAYSPESWLEVVKRYSDIFRSLM